MGKQDFLGNGRIPGTKNHRTTKLKDAISMLLEGKFEEFKQNMSLLKPADYCRVYLDLMRYVVPTLQAVAVKDETEEGKRAAYNILTDLRKGVTAAPVIPKDDADDSEKEE